MQICPERSRLAELLDGSDDDPMHKELEAHLSECVHCQAAVLDLGAGPHSWDRWRRVMRGALAPEGSDGLSNVDAALDAPFSQMTDDLPQVPGYDVLGELGRGGMAVVYRARHRELNRLVAMKMIPGGIGAGPDRLARFRQEAGAVARLQHPNIIQIYDVGVYRGQPYLALELVDGGSLAALLAGSPQRPADAARLVETLALAIDHAHRHGILHRDLKPGNILLTNCEFSRASTRAQMNDFIPKIADFGLAKLTDDDSNHTQTGEVLGTPSYMAPEQATGQGAHVGPACDVYALGVILYECLTGRPPFKGTSPLDTLAQVIKDEPARPRQLQPGIPSDLETICLKCLEKSPLRRYATAQDVADELRRFLRGEPIEARAVSTLERGLKWIRRNPTAAALLAVSVVAVLSLGGVLASTWYGSRLGEAKHRAEMFQYFHHVARAAAGWRDGNMTRVESLLDNCPVEQRRWEWHYLKRLCHTELQTFRGHTNWVDALAISPNGSLLASASKDGTIRLWDVHSGKELRTLPGHLLRIFRIAFSPDGTRLAAPCLDNTICLWNVATGKNVLTLRGHTDIVVSVAMSPDGSRLASASADKSIKVWDLATGQAVLTLQGHTDLCCDTGFSLDGKRIISTGQDQRIRIWDAITGDPVATLDNHSGWVTHLAISPSGERFATASHDATVRVWDLAGREEHVLKGHSSGVNAVAFSPDGKHVASASMDQTIKVWDLATGQVIVTHKGHVNAATNVIYSIDGSRLVSASMDRTIRVWDATESPEVLTLRGHTGRVWTVAFSPDGLHFASGSDDNTACIWDARTCQKVHTLDGHARGVYGIAFSPDGSTLATASSDKTVKVWDVTSGRETATFTGYTDVVWGVCFSPDGSRLASACFDRTVKVWDLAAAGTQPLTISGHVDCVLCVLFDPDGKRIVSCGRSGVIHVSDAATGRLLKSLTTHTDSVEGLAISRDGLRLASTSNDLSVRLWDLETGRETVAMYGHTWPVTSIAYSPDGARVASTSGDGTVRLWDTKTGQEALVIGGHTHRVQGVAFSPDGARLIAGSHDGTIRVWDARY
jgi:WD40 repeat protein/serine/threonine protein kinase